MLFAHQALDANKFSISVTHVPDLVKPQLAPVGTREPSGATQQVSESDDDFESDIGGTVGNATQSVLADERVSDPNRVSFLKPSPRAATQRRITEDLTEDDEIIVKMKAEQYTDIAIAEALRKRGTIYNSKTISTRWKRIRVKLAQKNERELDAGFVEWSHEHDLLLLDAVHEAGKTIQLMKDEAESQKWALVTNTIRKSHATANYSQRSCRERFESLTNLTAVVPPDLDDNPEERQAMREAKEILYHSKLAKEAEEKEQARNAKMERDRIKARLSAARSREKQKRRLLEQSTGDPDVHIEAREPPRSSLLVQTSDRQSDAVTRQANGQNGHDEKGDALDIPGRKGTYRAHEPKEISFLSRKAELAIRTAELQKNPRKFLDGMGLLPLDVMTRDEIRAELKARGVKRDGIKERLVEMLRAARTGTDRPAASSLPADDIHMKQPIRKKRKLKSIASKVDGHIRDGNGGALTKHRKVMKSSSRVPSESPPAPSAFDTLDGTHDSARQVTGSAADIRLRQVHYD